MRSHGKSADFSEREEQNTAELGFMELSDSRNDVVDLPGGADLNSSPNGKI